MPMVQCECSSSGLLPIAALIGGNERASAQRRQKAARVFDIYRIHIGAFGKRAGAGDVVSVVVDRTQREDQRADHVLAARGFDHARAGDVGIRVVHRIGQREPAHAVVDESLEHERHELGAGRFPGNKTKAGGEKLQRRLRHGWAISRMRSQGSSFLKRTATPMWVEVVKSMALKPTRSMTGAMVRLRLCPRRAPTKGTGCRHAARFLRFEL